MKRLSTYISVIALFVALGLAGSAQAAVHFVAPWGNERWGEGTYLSPWTQTVAEQRAEPGDLVIVEAYPGYIYRGGLQLNRPGLPGEPIRWMGMDGTDGEPPIEEGINVAADHNYVMDFTTVFYCARTEKSDGKDALDVTLLIVTHKGPCE